MDIKWNGVTSGCTFVLVSHADSDVQFFTFPRRYVDVIVHFIEFNGIIGYADTFVID